MSKTLTLRLTVEVEYTPNGTDPHELKEMLHSVATRVAGEGLLSGETPAEVESWKYKVETVKE